MICDDETNFSRELLLTVRQVPSIRKVFKNIHQPILNYQKTFYQRLHNQEDFLVDYLVHC